MTEFRIKKSYMTFGKVAAFIFFLLALLSLFIPLFPDFKGSGIGGYIIVLYCSGGNAFIAILIYFSLRQLRYVDITTDEDGLWYTHKGKEAGFVAWDSIYRFWYSQEYCDVLDYDGNKLIRISDHLKDLDKLRTWLLEAAEKNIEALEAANISKARDFIVEKKVITKTRLYFAGVVLVFIPAVIYQLVSLNLQSMDLGKDYFVTIFLIVLIFLGYHGVLVLASFFLGFHFGRKSFILPHAAITLDNEGLWYKQKSIGYAPISWKRIHKLKERHFRQCLDILDFNGQRVLCAEYELKDFVILRNRLLEKVEQNYDDVLSDCFPKGYVYHLVYAIIIVVILVVAFYLGRLVPEMSLMIYISSIICSAVLFVMYLLSYYRVLVAGHELIFIAHLRRKHIDFADIKSVEMTNNYEQGIRGSGVYILTQNDEAHILQDFMMPQRVDAHVLYLSLKKAIEEYTGSSEDKDGLIDT